jgi:hypothetical protein
MSLSGTGKAHGTGDPHFRQRGSTGALQGPALKFQIGGNRMRGRGLNSNKQRGGSMSKLDQEQRDSVPAREFAFPKQRKEPLEDAAHVRSAIARFNQVEEVTDDERDEAWKRIRAAARKFDVELEEGDWRELKAGGHHKR